ncbi:hypothetical protein Pmani_021074 [Petrolisthes manimaculis]|uniref:Uncharacterized protein n=1 Tax=Petrolisthes manimaculis TaxID=1843537 RepID=A0AAE1U5T4_9EUCA|nr:hypothetical protein Pmani_021074 [Petrolisthes manimaculis]
MKRVGALGEGKKAIAGEGTGEGFPRSLLCSWSAQQPTSPSDDSITTTPPVSLHALQHSSIHNEQNANPSTTNTTCALPITFLSSTPPLSQHTATPWRSHHPIHNTTLYTNTPTRLTPPHLHVSHHHTCTSHTTSPARLTPPHLHDSHHHIYTSHSITPTRLTASHLHVSHHHTYTTHTTTPTPLTTTPTRLTASHLHVSHHHIYTSHQHHTLMSYHHHNTLMSLTTTTTRARFTATHVYVPRPFLPKATSLGPHTQFHMRLT